MKRFVLSRHAKERIIFGDAHGKRTRLSPKEVLEGISEGQILSLADGIYLYSETDNLTFYLPTVDTQDHKRLVKTLFPARLRETWPRFVAEFRRIGTSMLLLSNNSPKLKYQNMVMVRLVRFDNSTEKLVSEPPLFSWFVKNRNFSVLLREAAFHHFIVEFVNSWYATSTKRDTDMNLFDIVVGYYLPDNRVFSMRFPLSISYEVSRAKPAFKLERI